MLALYVCGLTANVAVGVMARAAVGVSVREAARNKPMRLIGSQLLSQLSVA